MATLNTRDPVQGLIDYVKDVKPFHTKILEVWVEYIYTDAVSGRVVDAMKMVVDIAFDRRDKFCKYGFDTQPWNELLSGLTFEETVPGSIPYNGTSVPRSTAYRLYFDYIQANWRWMEGVGPQPLISADPLSMYYILSFPEVFNACRAYFAEAANSHEYWFDPSAQKLFKRLNNEWHEQSAYISTVHPPYPVEQDLWVSTTNSLLYIYLGGGWEEIYDMYTSYTTPKTGPKAPIDWMSNWDAPTCLPPFGENVAYTFVEDRLEFTHGSELFLLDRVRGMVYDPTGENNTLSSIPGVFTQRTEYPIKYRTTITQDPSGRFKIERAEVSILTEPNNPEIVGNPYTVYLDGMEFEGFGLDRQRKGVRLNEFLVWRFKSETEGMQLIADDIINRDTFGYKVDNGQLVAQRITTNGLEDIDCPFNDGQVVYFTSSDDLPAYNLLTQDSRRSVPLQRYVPYRIVKITDRHFSVAILRLREKYDPVTGMRIPSTDIGKVGYKEAGNTIYEIDTELMGVAPYLNFVTQGHGEMFFGIGHPVPFIEQRGTYQDSMTGRFREGLTSTTETFLGSKYVEILDVLVGYNDNGITRNGFVLDGNYPFTTGEIFKVVNSSDSLNDGDWTVTNARVWSNRWAGFELDGTPIPAAAPVWWNDIKLGPWTDPVKRPQKEIDTLIINGQYEDEYSEYYYTSVTTVGVGGVSPSQLYPHGSVVSHYYAFGEPSLIPNMAATQVSDVLRFGSYILTEKPGGGWEMVPEVGVPGVSVNLTELISVKIQEQFEPNAYGIPTIGSYDVHYYDLHSFDGGVQE